MSSSDSNGFVHGLRRVFRIWQPGQGPIEGILLALLRVGGLMTALIVMIGLIWQVVPFTRDPKIIPTSFVFWSLATAFSAFLAGAALGLLFGLPTAQRHAQSGTDGKGDVASSTGYTESTSLEQVADFLVKGLVALTLTSFSRWSVVFENLATNVTAVMLGRPGVSPAPGGLLIAGYAVLGFLIAYLWMRRWFIGEMVLAQNEQVSMIRDRIQAEKAKIAEARSDNRVGNGSGATTNIADIEERAIQIATQALQLVAKNPARAAAEKLQDAVKIKQVPDDPWKGQFGGLFASNNCTLSATVTSLITDPNKFQIDLTLTVDDTKRVKLAASTALFYLHPTFGSKPQLVPIGGDGRATLQLFGWGAFTVGVLLDDGTTLELDLAEIKGVPKTFRER